ATGAALHLGRRITALDPRARSVTDDRGTVYRYQKLLLATGGVPRRLPLETDQIIYFRTLDDYRRLRALASHSVRFAGIAGGCLGRRAGSCVVRTTLGGGLVAEVLVAGLGIVPGVELAEQAGLRVDNGIVVDEACRTSQIDIYAAGDVANFANPALRARLRVEH